MIRPFWVALGAVLHSVVPLPAQSWTFDASAGGARHDAVAADVGGRNAMLGLRYEGISWLYLAGGVPLDSGSVPWFAAGAGARPMIPFGELELGFDLTVNGHAYRVSDLAASGGGATLSGLPIVAWSAGAVRVQAYSGGFLQHTRFGLGAGAATETRMLHDSGAGVTVAAREGLQVELNGRYLRADQGSYPYLGGSATYARGPVQVWGAAGEWRFDGSSGIGWAAGALIELNRSTRTFASFASDPTDPIYFNLPRQRWTVGLSRELGRRTVPAASAPVPVADAGALTTFSIPLELAAEPPAIAGDFTDWVPLPMRREGDAWLIELTLEPGLHHYAFVRGDGSWFVPESMPTVDDGFGGRSAQIIVQ